MTASYLPTDCGQVAMISERSVMIVSVEQAENVKATFEMIAKNLTVRSLDEYFAQVIHELDSAIKGAKAVAIG